MWQLPWLKCLLGLTASISTSLLVCHNSSGVRQTKANSLPRIWKPAR